MSASCFPETPVNSPVHRNRLLCQLTCTGGEQPEEAVLATILDACFPDFESKRYSRDVVGIGSSSSEADSESGPAKKAFGVEHEFFADRAPLAYVVTLSKYMPDIRFTLTCWNADDAERNGGCEAEFLGGEIVRYRTATGGQEVPDWAHPSGNRWLRGLAEKLLDKSFGIERSEVEDGFDLHYREQVAAGLALGAFNYLKSLMDPIDRRMLAASLGAHQTQLTLCWWRRKAADASVSVRDFADSSKETGPTGSILTPEEVEQLEATSRLLRKIAGGVPAKSDMC